MKNTKKRYWFNRIVYFVILLSMFVFTMIQFDEQLFLDFSHNWPGFRFENSTLFLGSNILLGRVQDGIDKEILVVSVCLFVSFRFVHPNRSNSVLTRYDFGSGRSENCQVTDDQRRVGPGSHMKLFVVPFTHPVNLTWQWKITIFLIGDTYIFKWLGFLCHVSFRRYTFQLA